MQGKSNVLDSCHFPLQSHSPNFATLLWLCTNSVLVGILVLWPADGSVQKEESAGYMSAKEGRGLCIRLPHYFPTVSPLIGGIPSTEVYTSFRQFCLYSFSLHILASDSFAPLGVGTTTPSHCSWPQGISPSLLVPSNPVHAFVNKRFKLYQNVLIWIFHVLPAGALTDIDEFSIIHSFLHSCMHPSIPLLAH